MSKPTQYTTPLVPASSATLILHAQRRIAAPAALVFGTLRNTETWKDWHDLVPKVTIRHQPEDGGIGGEYGDATLNMDNRGSVGSAKGTGRTKRKLSSRAKTLEGEPSLRLKIGTEVTFHARTDPHRPEKYTDSNLVVTEVSRPTDIAHDLARSETHTAPPPDNPVYRISYASDTNHGFPASMPRWMLFAQRVYEVRPIVLGDGHEECEITTWECMGGVLARVVKSMYGKYLQGRFEQALKDLGEFCEAMGGKVDRKDFSVPNDSLGHGVHDDL